MRYTLHTQRITLTALDTEHLEKRLAHLEKRLAPPYTAQVTITHDAHHRKGQVINCTLTIAHGKMVFHATRAAETVATSIDEVAQAVTKELSKAKEKGLRKARRKAL